MFHLPHILIKLIGSFLSDCPIVGSFLSNPHSINAGVPQDPVTSPVLFIFFVNDLLSSTSSSIHSFAEDTYLNSSCSFDLHNPVYGNIPRHRGMSISLLINNLTKAGKWRKGNLVSFNPSKNFHCSDFHFTETQSRLSACSHAW